MERVTKYILVNLAGLLSILLGWLMWFGLGLIAGSNLLFR